MLTICNRAFAAIAAALLAAHGAAAQDTLVFDDRQAGSVLVFPLFDVNNAPGTAKSTLIKISNLSRSSNAFVHLIRICGAAKSFGGQGLCQASDRTVKLTPRETFVRDVASFFGIDRDNCPTGYILAYAQRSIIDTTPIVFNNLIGSAHINGAGALNQRAAAMQAYGFIADSSLVDVAPQVITCQVPGIEGDQVCGSEGGPFPLLPFVTLFINNFGFVGAGYFAPARVYHTDFLATAGSRATELVLLTLNIQAGAQNDPTLVALDWNNQNEEPFSGAIEYVCHVKVQLDDEVNAAQPGAGVQGGANFRAANLGSGYGILTITPSGTDAILGAVVEKGQNRLTLRGLWHDNQPQNAIFIGR